MLRDRYEADKVFLDISKLLTLEMDPVLEQIDQILDDDKLFKLLRADLAKRYPHTLQTGRNSTPVEVALRMLAIKRLYHFSYETTERQVSDSLVLRRFCRVYLEKVPDDTTLIRLAHLIRPATLEKFNQRITALATQAKVTRGRKLRTDGTVTESHIHAPSDSSLLADSVRVLGRTLTRAKAVLGEQVQTLQETLAAAAGPSAGEVFRNRVRSARRAARQIGEHVGRRSAEAQNTAKKAYRRLVRTTQQTVQQAQQVLTALQAESSQVAERLADTLETFIPRAQQVIDQTVRRVLHGEQVPASEKLVSIFEAHTDIIVRGKVPHATEYGHKVWLDEVDGGIVSAYRVLEGNPRDDTQWEPALQQHEKQFGHPPEQASADRGLYSPDNEACAQRHGVKHVILPQPGYQEQARRQHERQPWFRRGRRWHAGVEGRISVAKRAHGLDRCLDHGRPGFEKWVGWGVIAGNLAVMGRTLAAREARKAARAG